MRGSHLSILPHGSGIEPEVLKTNEVFRTCTVKENCDKLATSKRNTRGFGGSRRITKTAESTRKTRIKPKAHSPKFEIRVQNPYHVNHTLSKEMVILTNALRSRANYCPEGKLLILSSELGLINRVTN
jgi:hypothetical protein